MRALSRMWQMLLKALEEVAVAPNAMMAAEMAVIRLTHVADLPTPEDLVRRLRDLPRPASPPAPAPAAGRAEAGGPAGRAALPRAASSQAQGGAATALALEPAQALARFASFAQVLDLITANRDMTLKIEVEAYLRLARYSPGRIEFSPAEGAPRDLASRLQARLQGWTGVRWGVSVVSGCIEPTLAEQRDREARTATAKAAENPLVRAVLDAFPGARIAVRPAAVAEAAAAALPVVDDEWDPFEED